MTEGGPTSREDELKQEVEAAVPMQEEEAGEPQPEGEILARSRRRFLKGDPSLPASNERERKKGLKKPTHTVEEQIDYMNSEEFKEAYKGLPVYKQYRRNIIGQYLMQPPPRLFCIDRTGRFNVNHACPVCRDEYLFFDYRNPMLIEMFLYPGTDQPINLWASGLCREQYAMLKAQHLKAKEHGTMTFALEFRRFDYGKWYKEWKEPEQENQSLVEDRHSWKYGRIEDVYEGHQQFFPTHNRDVDTNWDQYWLRHAKFTRKGR